MKKITLVVLALLGWAVTAAAQEAGSRATSNLMEAFTEHFDKASSSYFNYGSQSFMYYSGVPSLSEKETDVLVMRISPDGPAGAGRGPEISTKKRTHFGTYSARIRVPDVKKVQPNVGSVVGYFTYRMDPALGLSEIDFEWLIADPTIVYIGTWTGPSNALQRVGRIIKLDTGRIYETIYRSPVDGNRNHPVTGIGNQPETIEGIAGYDASKRFYTYGFDWFPDRLTWWILHPETEEKVILWDYRWNGESPFTGIPEAETNYLLNFWHTSDWAVQTNPRSLEQPAYPYALEVDWMSYEPYDEINEAWSATR